jgi:hypothetical protein
MQPPTLYVQSNRGVGWEFLIPHSNYDRLDLKLGWIFQGFLH